MTAALTADELMEAARLYAGAGSITKVARLLGVVPSTARRRLQMAVRRNLVPPPRPRPRPCRANPFAAGQWSRTLASADAERRSLLLHNSRRPIDIAIDHCLWARDQGLTPRAVASAVGGKVGHQPVSWEEALDWVLAAAEQAARSSHTIPSTSRPGGGA